MSAFMRLNTQLWAKLVDHYMRRKSHPSQQTPSEQLNFASIVRICGAKNLRVGLLASIAQNVPGAQPN
jgi:hypothetical protein